MTGRGGFITAIGGLYDFNTGMHAIYGFFTAIGAFMHVRGITGMGALYAVMALSVITAIWGGGGGGFLGLNSVGFLFHNTYRGTFIADIGLFPMNTQIFLIIGTYNYRMSTCFIFVQWKWKSWDTSIYGQNMEG